MFNVQKVVMAMTTIYMTCESVTHNMSMDIRNEKCPSVRLGKEILDRSNSMSFLNNVLN